MNEPEFIKNNPWINVLEKRGKDNEFTGVNKNCNNSNNSNTEFKIKNKIKLNNNKINNENISQKSITITTIITKNDNRCKLTYFNLALEFLRKNYEFTQKAFFLYLMEIGCSYFTARNYFYLFQKMGYIIKINRKIWRSRIFEVK